MNPNYDRSNNADSEKKIGALYYTIANRIKHQRKVHRMTQLDLGNKVGLSANAISSYEKPYCEIPVENLSKIANVFNLNIGYFTSDDATLDINLKLQQQFTYNLYIPYYKHTNTSGILNKDIKISDGCMTLPKKMNDGTNVICTDIPDNSMINLQYKQGELILVDTDARPLSGNIVLLYDKEANKMILRKCIIEGLMITFVADGYGDNAPIQTDITNNDYIVIGPVIRSTRDH